VAADPRACSLIAASKGIREEDTNNGSGASLAKLPSS
jgi:hypothetical protein